MKIQLFTALWSAFAFSSLANAAVLDIGADGILHGAHNVDVDGWLYDVRFVDGSYADLYGGSASNFDASFGTIWSFTLALADQVVSVWQSGEGYNYAANIAGCTNSSECNVFTPYTLGTVYNYAHVGTSILLGGVIRAYAEPNETCECLYWFPGDNAWITSYDTTIWDSFVFADWSATGVAAVPVPATAWLLGSGLLALTGMARKRKAH